MNLPVNLERSTPSRSNREVPALRRGELPYRVRVRRMGENRGYVWSLRETVPSDFVSWENWQRLKRLTSYYFEENESIWVSCH